MLMNGKDLSRASGLALDIAENKRLVIYAGRFSGASLDVYEKSASLPNSSDSVDFLVSLYTRDENALEVSP